MALRDYRGLLADKASSIAHLATKDKVGLVKPDNDTITIGSDGTIKAKGGSSSIPIASDTVLGGVKVGENLSITQDGVLSATGGGSGTLKREYLTLAEWNSRKTAGTLEENVDYITTDETGGGGGSGEGINYSLEEQDTGLKWVDGKRIYQKTIITQLASSTNTWIHYNFNIEVDEFINLSGRVKTVGGTIAPLEYSRDSNNMICWTVTNGSTSLDLLHLNSAFNNAQVVCTIQYTKTTD